MEVCDSDDNGDKSDNGDDDDRDDHKDNRVHLGFNSFKHEWGRGVCQSPMTQCKIKLIFVKLEVDWGLVINF